MITALFKISRLDVQDLNIVSVKWLCWKENSRGLKARVVTKNTVSEARATMWRLKSWKKVEVVIIGDWA